MMQQDRKPTIRSVFFNEYPENSLRFSALKAGENLAYTRTWEDLHEVVHFFCNRGIESLAPKGLVRFVYTAQSQHWASRPMTQARADQANRMVRAAAAAFDDPVLYQSVKTMLDRRAAEADAADLASAAHSKPAV